MQTHTQEILEALQTLPLEKRGVVVGILFGSTARADAGPRSDVDVAFLLQEPFEPTVKLDLIGDVQDALKRDDVDVVILNGLLDEEPLLAIRIMAEGIMFHDAVPGARVDFQIRALKMAEDARHLLRIQDEAIRSRLDGR